VEKKSELNKKKKKMHLSKFIVPSFSYDVPSKIGEGIEVSGQNTVIKTEYHGHAPGAIADESIDATVDGTTIFCVRAECPGVQMMVGYTTMASFDLMNSGVGLLGLLPHNGNL
jgi:hypothetical protein